MSPISVYQAEINQLHNAVCDFSHQSVSIKKLSITIYITFLSVFFTFNNGIQTMPRQIVLVIGCIIPVFCYVYEIYIDYTRQSLRAKMNNLFIKVEQILKMHVRDKKSVRATIFGLDIDRKSHCKLQIELHYKADKKSYYYINLLHFMYIIYLLEIIATIMIGIFI